MTIPDERGAGAIGRAAPPSPSDPLRVSDAVTRVASMLTPALGSLAQAESRELVSALYGAPRYWPSLAANEVVSPERWKALEAAAIRRTRGAPLAYAVRNAPFRHLTLYVDERVLIPRPETERLLDLVLAHPASSRGGVAVDVGTGSGAIAVALATEGRFARVVATDVSNDALAVAEENARATALPEWTRLEFRAGDALAPLADLSVAVDVLASNPPYIAFHEAATLPSSVRDWEPPQALTCAEDGLALTRAIVAGAGGLVTPGGLLALEVDERRAERVAALVHGAGGWRDVRVERDLTGRDRFVLATRHD